MRAMQAAAGAAPSLSRGMNLEFDRALAVATRQIRSDARVMQRRHEALIRPAIGDKAPEEVHRRPGLQQAAH